LKQLLKKLKKQQKKNKIQVNDNSLILLKRINVISLSFLYISQSEIISMKKTIIQFLIFCFIFNNAVSQEHVTINYIESRLITHQNVEFIGELNEVNDDLYAFEDWDNKGVIFIGDKQYLLANLNFNVSNNTFTSRVKRDQLFLYKTAELDSVSINSHMFKKVGNAFFEVLFEEEKNQFLKKYVIRYKAGSVNRLSGSVGKPSIFLGYKYLVKMNNDFISVELNKKSILKLLTDGKNFNNFVNFVEREDLSYKREDDTVKMVEFIFKNS